MAPPSPSVVLAAYAEPLLDGRRVVVFGDATTDLSAELVERGARSVHVYDPEPARAALASNQNRAPEITVVPLDSADIAVRDGAFDVALIPDLSGVPAAETLLRRVRRALSPRGTALIASPNPEARFTLTPHTSGSRRDEPLGYYELYDAVSAVFDDVRMLGQTPFVGYAIVDFAPDDAPDVSLDSGLLPTGAEEPEWFVALAGNDAARPDAYSIIQLPASGIVTGGSAALESDLRAARGREAELLERVSGFESRNDAKAAGDAKARADALAQELAQRDVRILELESQLKATDARASQASAEAASLKKRAADEGTSAAALAALTQEKADLAAKLTRLSGQDETLASLTREKADLAAKLNRLAGQDAALAALTKEKADLAAKLARLAGQDETIAALTKEKADLAAKLARLTSENEKLARLATENEKLTRDVAAALAQETAAQKALLQRDAEKAKLEQGLAAAEARIAKLTAVEAAGAPDDVSRLEATLEERGARLRQLEKDLREAERVGRELVRELKAAHSAGETRSVGLGDGEALGQENARLRADLEALSWTIQELEGRLSRASASVAR